MPPIFRRRLVFAIAFVGVCASASLADEKPDISSLKAAPITVEARPITSFVRSGPERPLGKLKFLGGLVLTSPSPYFGGWSGLLLDDEAKTFLALSDSGVWMSGSLTYSGRRLSGVTNARLGPLLDRSGRPLPHRRDRDSEIDRARRRNISARLRADRLRRPASDRAIQVEPRRGRGRRYRPADTAYRQTDGSEQRLRSADRHERWPL